MAETEFSLMPGLPDTGGNEAVWWVRFHETEMEPTEHPLALYVCDDVAGLLANHTGERFVIEDGSQYVTTTSQKYTYSLNVDGRTVPMRTGYLVQPDVQVKSGLLNRKVDDVPKHVCGATLPPREWGWPPIEVGEELEKSEFLFIKDRVTANYESGEIVTDRELKRDVYDQRRFGSNSADEWWEKTGLSFFNDSDLVEKCDSTGRRWKVTEE